MQTPKFQVCFQGGGAKLAPLLAAAGALRQAERAGALEVTRVAGTSAGAIVAAAYAAGADFHTLSLWLSREASVRLSAISQGVRYDQPMSWRSPTAWNLASKVMRSVPLGDVHALRSLVRDMFANDALFSGDRPAGRVSFSIPLRTIAADLLTGHKLVYNYFDDNSILAAPSDSVDSPRRFQHVPIGPDRSVSIDDLSEHLVSSCALPVFFRTRESLSGGAHVDGGLVDNFPVDELDDSEEASEFGPVLGFGFDATASDSPPQNFLSYLARLLFTSIDASTRRSQARVGSARFHVIRTKLGTLDFYPALEVVPGQNDYDRVESDAARWLENVVNDAVTTHREFDVPGLLELNYELYNRCFAGAPPAVERIVMRGTVRPLCTPGAPGHSAYMETKEILVFKAPSDHPVYCYRMAIATGKSELGRLPDISIQCSQPDACPELVVVPALSAGEFTGYGSLLGNENVLQEVLVYFSPPLAPTTCTGATYTLERRSYRLDGLADIETEGDFFGCGNFSSPEAGVLDLVVDIPTDYPELSASPEHPKIEETVNGTEGSNLVRDFRPLDEAEIVNLYGSAPAHFRSLGWRAENVGQKSLFLLHLKKA